MGGIGRDLILIVAVAVISGMVGLPFSYAQTFGIEVRFGFNRTTRALWVADLLKGILIGAALGLPLAALVLWLMRGLLLVDLGVARGLPSSSCCWRSTAP